MTAMPPSPFIVESSVTERRVVEATAVAAPHVAAAGLFDGPDIPLAELVKRGFDEEAFMAKIEPMPLFLQAPIDALRVLARH